MSTTTKRVWDWESNRYIEVEVIYDGGPLPWQHDDDPAFRGSGSNTGMYVSGFSRGELPSEREVRGKIRPQAQPAHRPIAGSHLTPAQRNGILRDRFTHPIGALAVLHRCSEHQVRLVLDAAKSAA